MALNLAQELDSNLRDLRLFSSSMMAFSEMNRKQPRVEGATRASLLRRFSTALFGATAGSRGEKSEKKEVFNDPSMVFGADGTFLVKA